MKNYNMKLQEITLDQVSSTEAVNNAIQKQWIFEEFNDSLNTLRDWVLEELDVTIESYGDLTTKELDKLAVIEMRIIDDLFSRTYLLKKIAELEEQLSNSEPVKMEDALTPDQIEALKEDEDDLSISELLNIDFANGECNGYYSLTTKSISVELNGSTYIAEKALEEKALYNEEFDLLHDRDGWVKEALFSDELLEKIYDALEDAKIDEVIYND